MLHYVLDTDHVSLLQHNHPAVTQRFSHLLSETSITVISIEEQMQGWLKAIRQAEQRSQPQRLSWAYWSLGDAVDYLSRFQRLRFDEVAHERFIALRQEGVRIGTQDLRIASIALVNQLTLVTRNQQDFAQVTGLQLEDWTQSRP